MLIRSAVRRLTVTHVLQTLPARSSPLTHAGRVALVNYRRTYASGTQKVGGLRISTVFTALLVLGIGSTSYGLYSYYTSFHVWPEELRADLRSAVKLQIQGDLQNSERHFRRALTTAYLLPPAQLAPDEDLKTSGISIALAAVLEDSKQPAKAYEVLKDAWKEIVRPSGSNSTTKPNITSSATYAAPTLPQPSRSLSPQTQLRAISIAHKLGSLAEQMDLTMEEEQWKVWAVEEMLRMTGVAAGNQQAPLQKDTTSQSSTHEREGLLLSELQLPHWVSMTDVGAPVEALGEFYARKGNIEYAVPLYLQALSILLPPPTSRTYPPSAEDRCRAAQLMSNLSQLFLSNPSNGVLTAEVLAQSKAWAQKGHDVAQKARQDISAQPSSIWPAWLSTRTHPTPEKDAIDVCETAWAVILFNLGMVSEMSKDQAAFDYFAQSLEQSKKMGLREGIQESKKGLARVQARGLGTRTPSPRKNASDQ